MGGVDPRREAAVSEDQPVREDRPTVQPLIEEFDLDEDDAKFLRAIEALLEHRAARGKDNKGGVSWDHTYKGPEHWLLFRAKALAIVHQNAYITWGLLDEDPWFRKDSPPEGDGGGMQDHKQWQGALYAHLIKNKPEGPEEFVAFQTREKGTRYVTIRRYLHCAIAKVVGKRKAPEAACGSYAAGTGPRGLARGTSADTG